jgi:hypothetical protein
MSVLSKFASDTSTEPILSWDEYFEKNIDLNKWKVDALKRIAKQNGIYVSGTKPILIDRIVNLFNKTRKTVILQAIYRGSSTRKILQMRGIGLKDRKKCVNEVDFFTLDSIHDVDVQNFFSYTDGAGFTYGFDLHSLKTMMKKNVILTNPYNREKFDETVVSNINKLFRHISLEEVAEGENNTVFDKIKARRNKPAQIRIRELFCEIDSLGNYTKSEWFSLLNQYEYIGFYRNIYEIWSYRANMSSTTKGNICPYFNPFRNGLARFGNDIHVLNIDDLRLVCLTIMENLIYTGMDDEYRKLGALHVLSALTLVSIPAKDAMPWLYESLVF